MSWTGADFATLSTVTTTSRGHSWRLRTLHWTLAISFVAMGAPALCQTTAAQTGSAPRRPEIPNVDPETPDFLFGRPDGWVGLRAGWLIARGGSDWYDFVSNQLTIGEGDFNTLDLSADVGVTLSSRLDAVAGVSFSRAHIPSEYRRLVDNNRLPISQETRLRTVNVTGSARLALRSRGREVSRLAWVPHDLVPFVGAGGGALHYALDQSGDFVDFRDSRVFASTFRSTAWTPSAHVFGGVDIRVLRRTLISIDGRYQWAAGPLGSTWVDFDPIDLSGFKLSAGAHVVF